MKLAELLRKSRSYRRFREDRAIDEPTLVELVGLTRLCPAAANRQPLKYVISWQAEQNARVFDTLRWAAALEDWPGPAPGERPAGYIVILGDTQIAEQYNPDPGIVAQSMMLGAVAKGLGGCMVGSIDRPALRQVLHIPERFKILLVLALGEPNETVVLDDSRSPDDVPYWRDAEGVHHVPKRSLEEILLRF